VLELNASLRRFGARLFLYLGVLLVVSVFLFPVYWIFSTAVKPPLEVFRLPPKLIFPPTLSNFASVVQRADFIHLVMNSLVAALGSTFLSLVLAFPAAYSFARFKIRRKNDLAFAILSLRMFPPIAVAVPFFIMYKRVGLYDTQLGLVLIYATSNIPFALWLLIGFIKEIPPELEEAALVDGASVYQTLYKIVLPLLRTGILATGTLCFIMSWNEFFFALILTGRNASTLPVFLYTFINFREVQWGALTAAAVIMSAPLVIISIFIRRYLIRGLTFGAVKG